MRAGSLKKKHASVCLTKPFPFFIKPLGDLFMVRRKQAGCLRKPLFGRAPETLDEAQTDGPESNPIKPDQTESNPIEPDQTA